MSKILIHLKRIPLLGRVVIAIILGIMLGQFVPVWFARSSLRLTICLETSCRFSYR